MCDSIAKDKRIFLSQEERNSITKTLSDARDAMNRSMKEFAVATEKEDWDVCCGVDINLVNADSIDWESWYDSPNEEVLNKEFKFWIGEMQKALDFLRNQGNLLLYLLVLHTFYLTLFLILQEVYYQDLKKFWSR